MAKDFFDEEFDRVEQDKIKNKIEQDANRRQDFDEWYNYQNNDNLDNGGAPRGNGGGSKTTTKRPLYIGLICLGIVLSIVFGWVLCAVFGGNTTQSQEEQLLSTTLDYLENKYYLDVSDEKVQSAISAAGTAILQTGGDRFSQLMSPQQYYDYINQVQNVGIVGGNNGMFGISFTYLDGVGLGVSSVVSDSSCYGQIEVGDIVLKMSDIVYDNAILSMLGDSVPHPETIVVTDYSYDTVTLIMTAITSARFHVLRDGDVVQTDIIERGEVGLETPNPEYDFQFVEFYFDSTHNNISTTNQNKAKHNTYELRSLDKLPADTGYLRLTEFMYYTEGRTTITAATEFEQAMNIFKQLGLKRLVLDLKGNPGGLVTAVCDIAGMLITDTHLTDAQKTTVAMNNKLLITSLVPRQASGTEREYRASTYNNYFGVPGSKCDIVVWTDGGSASASELLTGALSDYGTAVQMGTKTYGKGIAQTVETLPYSGKIVTSTGNVSTGPWAIYYTFASYYSPLGTNIHGVGYTPSKEYDGLNDYVSLWNAVNTYWAN